MGNEPRAHFLYMAEKGLGQWEKTLNVFSHWPRPGSDKDRKRASPYRSGLQASVSAGVGGVCCAGFWALICSALDLGLSTARGTKKHKHYNQQLARRHAGRPLSRHLPYLWYKGGRTHSKNNLQLTSWLNSLWQKWTQFYKIFFTFSNHVTIRVHVNANM